MFWVGFDSDRHCGTGLIAATGFLKEFLAKE
jgi:hypothetical protein